MNAFTTFLPTHAMFVEAVSGHSASETSAPSAVLPVSQHSTLNTQLPRDPITHLDMVSRLQHRITEFQLSRFPMQTLPGKLAHLAREVDELRKQPDDITEWADVFILILGSAANRGLTVRDLVQAAHMKMSVNESRQWGPADPEGVYHHINNPSRQSHQSETSDKS